jgi:hypothetical protein
MDITVDGKNIKVLNDLRIEQEIDGIKYLVTITPEGILIDSEGDCADDEDTHYWGTWVDFINDMVGFRLGNDEF